MPFLILNFKKAIYFLLFLFFLFSTFFYFCCGRRHSQPISIYQNNSTQQNPFVKSSKRDILVIAHRGASSDCPENTIPAFEKAIEIGADMIELDVQQTADNKIIVMHDETIDRTTNGSGKITELNSDYIMGLDAGSWFNTKFNGTKVPFLDEVLKIAKDKIIVDIEIKCSACAEEVLKIVENNQMEDKVIISSFNFDELKTFYAKNNKIRICPLVEEVDLNYNKSQLYQNFIPSAVIFKWDGRSDYKIIHADDIPVFTYTINDEESINLAADLGVEGIITDKPDLAISVLKNKSYVLKIVKGPYLQNVSQTGITIMWETNILSDSFIHLGWTSNYELTVKRDKTQKLIHEFPLKNLSVGRKYHYKVESSRASKVLSEGYTFKTAPAENTPFSFVAWGDNRTNFDICTEVAKLIFNKKPDFIINSGDIVESGISYNRWEKEYFTPLRSVMSIIPSFVSIGNHEQDAEWFYKFLSQPGNETWYSFNYGNAHFISINSEKDYSPESEQYKWLLSDLQSEKAKKAVWKFAFFHDPPYTEGRHSPNTNIQEILVPLFEQYKINMVFNGHNHCYERGYKNGIYYIVTGGGGASLYSWKRDDPVIEIFEKKFHYCLLNISGKQLQFFVYDNSDNLLDSLSINLQL